LYRAGRTGEMAGGVASILQARPDGAVQARALQKTETARDVARALQKMETARDVARALQHDEDGGT